jgi:hypothetical protein
MLRRLVAVLLAGALVTLSIGCAKQGGPKERELPKLPKGFESKPGFGGMGAKKPAAEPGKPEAPQAEGAVPAGETPPAAEPGKPEAPKTEGTAPAGETPPAIEPAKSDAPPTEGAAPAGGGDTEKKN